MKTSIVLTFGTPAALVAAIIGFFAFGSFGAAFVCAVAAVGLYVVIAKVAVG